jgi:hypothetical protein
MKCRWWGGATLCGLLALPVGAAQDDDLTVVKRATRQEPPAAAAVERKERADADRAVVRRAGKPQWLRVRVVERGGRKKVSVNLPLALVRALGDDFDMGWLCGRHRRRGGDQRDHHACSDLRLAEVLAALESGEDLVQVDDEEATVRVWIE